MPEVSVVIPSYNHAAYIGEAVQSVLGQTETDLELVIVDDGSSDNSLEVLAGFSDPRLRIFSQANQGAHAAINRGLREAQGAYLSILNSDDAYHPRRLEKALAALKADPDVGIAGSYIEVVDSQGKPIGIKHGYQDFSPWPVAEPERSFRAGNDLEAALLTENFLATTSNYVFSRHWYEHTGEFRPLRYAHDWDFALRVTRSARLCLLEEPLLRYRVHAHNTIRENQAAMVFEICWCLAVHLPQKLADAKFFATEPVERRVEQVLHSIYVFGCERVLSAMLAQNLAGNSHLALQLLNPDDPSRAAYIEFIQQTLAEGGPVQPNPEPAGNATRFSGLRRAASKVKRLLE